MYWKRFCPGLSPGERERECERGKEPESQIQRERAGVFVCMRHDLLWFSVNGAFIRYRHLLACWIFIPLCKIFILHVCLPFFFFALFWIFFRFRFFASVTNVSTGLVELGVLGETYHSSSIFCSYESMILCMIRLHHGLLRSSSLIFCYTLIGVCVCGGGGLAYIKSEGNA